MSGQRFHIPSFNRGVVNPAWASRLATAEQGLGLSAATNMELAEDGSLQRRLGTTFWQQLPGTYTAKNQTRMFPYRANDEEFLIVLTFSTSGGITDDAIKVFKLNKSTPEWETTQINWRENNTTDGIGTFAPYLSAGWGTSTNEEAHPYKLADANEIQAFQFEDNLFLLHPDYPTIHIRYNQSGVWDFDPYFMERRPPEIGNSRRNPLSGLTAAPTASAWIYDVTANQKLYQKDFLPGATATPPPPCAFNGTNVVEVGSFYRIGNTVITDSTTGDPVQSVGAFFSVQTQSSPYVGTMAAVMNQTGVGSSNQTHGGFDFGNSQDFAGPWTYSGETLTGVTVAASHSRSTAAVANPGGWTEDLVGCILYSPTLQTAFLCRLADTGGNVQMMNLGKDFTSAATGTLYVYRPEKPIFFITDNTGNYSAGGVDCWCVSGTQYSAPIPEGHDTNFVDVGWLRDNAGFASDQDTGGAIMVGNNGIMRCDALTDYNAGTRRHVQKVVCWYQVVPRHHGPWNDYGWGPSKGAGFASCGTAHQQRAFFSGFKKSNAAVVASAVNRVHSLNAIEETGLADAPLNLLMGFVQGDNPKFMHSGDQLIIGGESNLYLMDGNPISSSSLGFERVGNRGAERVQPVQMGVETVFVSNDGTDILAARFSDGVDSVVSRSLLRHADELIPAGETIIQLEQISEPIPTIYALLSGGTLLSLTYVPENQVEGWTKWELPGFDYIEAIAKVRRATDDGWDLWLQTRRRLSSVLEQTFEYVTPDNYLDCRQTGTSLTATTATFSNLDGRAEGISIIIDGKWGGTYVPAAGVVDFSALNLSGAPTEVIGGFMYDAEATLHMPSFPLENGPSAGAKLNLGVPILFVEGSVGGVVDRGDGVKREISSVTLNAVPTATTDWVPVVGIGTGPRSRFPQIGISQSHPWAFKVGGVAFEGGGET